VPTSHLEELTDGMNVFDVNDEQVGTVDEVFDVSTEADRSASGGGYLRVATGFLGLGREHHIPFVAIHDVSGGRIRLNVSRDDFSRLGYDRVPAEGDADVADDERGSAPAVVTDVVRPTSGER
jgi:hypothetical protein